jgi:hypothetical protein
MGTKLAMKQTQRQPAKHERLFVRALVVRVLAHFFFAQLTFIIVDRGPWTTKALRR